MIGLISPVGRDGHDPPGSDRGPAKFASLDLVHGTMPDGGQNADQSNRVE